MVVVPNITPPPTPTERAFDFEPLQPSERQICEDKGGSWDEETRTCIMNIKERVEVQQIKKEKAASEKEALEPAPQGSIVTNAETGEQVGFINSKGDFVSAKKGDIQAATQQAGAGVGGAVGGTTEQFAQQQRLIQSAQQIGNIGTLTAVQEAGINFSQAATAGAFGSIPGILGGIGVGALAGGKIGALGGIGGAALGAGVGAIGGFLSGIHGNIKEQQSVEIRAEVI